MAYEKIKNNLPVLLLTAVLIFSASFMVKGALGDSAIMDELAHIPAGYSYVKFLDYRLNPEHPPLLKALSALPLLGLNLNFDTDHKSWSKDINGQWEVGDRFLYLLGNDADKIIFLSRLFPILLTLITTILIYIWSKELFGRWWSLLPTLFFGFSPTVLAHGHYVTTDIAAGFGVVLATYFFIKFLANPKKLNLVFSGVALGVAELMKFSLVLLIPYFLIIAVFFLISSLKKRNLFYYVKSIILIFLIALAVIYAVYFILTLNYPPEKQKTDTATILNSFSPWPLAETVIKATENRLTRPLADYFLGFFMVLQRSAGGNTGYFLGEVSTGGSRLYFPLVFLMKEPLPSLLFVLAAIIAAIALFGKNLIVRKLNKTFFEKHFPEFGLLIFVAIYWAWSIKSPLNIGVRHLIPTFPFIYILGTVVIKNLKIPAKKFVIGGILLWLFLETAFASPYFLSYFNEAAGGTNYGYRYVTDSNYDWGQDLKRLKNWVDARNNNNDHNNDVEKIAVDYFGGGNPRYYLGERQENWGSAKGNPKDYGIEWLAVSVNTLESAFGKTASGFNRNQNDEYRWLSEIKNTPPGKGNVPEPDFKIGTSIFLYKL